MAHKTIFKCTFCGPLLVVLPCLTTDLVGYLGPGFCLLNKSKLYATKHQNCSFFFPDLCFMCIFCLPPAPCSCMAYHQDSRRIFIGQDNGSIVVN